MNRTSTLRLALAGSAVASALIAGLVAVPTAASALGSTPTSTGGGLAASRLADCKSHADTAIANRLTTLAADLTLVNAATHLTSSDKSTLTNLITTDQAGLSQLKTTIDGTTDLKTCIADAQTIVTAYRIYVLVDPKIHLTIAADRAEAAGAALQDASVKLQNAINDAKSHGKDVAGAQEALNDLNAKTAAALDAAGPVPGLVLPLQPSGYPGNATVLHTARERLENARADLRAARADAATVIADLR